MTQELEALKIGVDLGTEKDEQCAVINLHYKGVDHIIYETHDKEQVEALNKIKQQEAIDNAKPSEALKYVNGKISDLEDDLQHTLWSKNINVKSYFIREDLEQFTNIKQTLIKAQEQEKVLNIIIKKNVSVWGFRNRVFGYQKKQNGNRIINDTYEYYLDVFGCYHNGFDIELLTEEEFNLLKEMIK